MNVKQLKDALQDFVKGEREDLIEKTKKEINLIAEYLPTPMEREEIRKHRVACRRYWRANDGGHGQAYGRGDEAVGAAANGDDVRAEVEAFLSKENT